jgi:hypothetical protein
MLCRALLGKGPNRLHFSSPLGTPQPSGRRIERLCGALAAVFTGFGKSLPLQDAAIAASQVETG